VLNNFTPARLGQFPLHCATGQCIDKVGLRRRIQRGLPEFCRWPCSGRYRNQWR